MMNRSLGVRTNLIVQAAVVPDRDNSCLESGQDRFRGDLWVL